VSKDVKLVTLSVDALVERFAEICLAQDEALLYSNIAKFNRLFDQMIAIEDELKSRTGDQRIALTALFTHENAQVRLQAARAALAVVPEAALNVIKAIANGRKFPQAGDAGMTLDNLESGFFKPT
jgi:hypothetical protein